jgi:hypothetical protein
MRPKGEAVSARRIVDRTLAWLRASRRNQVTAVVAAIAVGATAVIVPLAAGGGGPVSSPPREEPQTFPAIRCGRAEAPAAPAPADRWSKLSLPPADDCGFRMSATRSSPAGVSKASAFVVESRRPIGAEDLAARLHVSPDIEFRVRAAGSSRFRIEPVAALAPGALYRFSLLGEPGGPPIREWAFQVESPLRVVQVLPANSSNDVPTNIGIELTFSHDGVTGVDKRFHISPATAGRFETHKRTVVFVPKALKPQTLYTVRLDAGVALSGTDEKTTEPFTFRFETGSAERSGDTPGIPPLAFSRSVWESPTADVPVLGLFAAGREGAAPPAETLPFTIYRYSGSPAFLGALDRLTAIPDWAQATRGRFTFPTAGLPVATSFRARLGRAGEFGEWYVRFPAKLPAGYYLVTTTFEKHPVRTLLQVTDLATYAGLSASKVLVWVNDIAAKAALPGAVVRGVDTTFSTATGADGVAFFTPPESVLRLKQDPLGYSTEQVPNLTVTAPDGRTAVVPLADVFGGFRSFDFREYVFSGDPSIYWRFLYADRRLYRQTDTVRFWGLVRERSKPLRAQDVAVEITSSEYGSEDGRPAVVARDTVKTSPSGTFIGSLPISSASAGFYELRAKIGDQVVASTSFEVRDIVKPAYKIDVVPSRKAAFVGDQVTFDVQASFFEGSPVPGAQLNYSGVSSGSVTTESSGRATVPFKASLEYGPVEMRSIEVTPALAEEGEIVGSGGVQVFVAALTMETSSIVVAGKARVDGTVYNVDLDRLNGDTAKDFEDYRGLAAAGRAVRAAVTEISYKRVETGETYDFIAKAVRKTYRYDEQRRAVGTFNATTDSRGRFSISFAAAQDRSYEVNLSTVDDAKRTYSRQEYVSSGYQPAADVAYVGTADEGPFAIGDPVTVSMRLGAADLPSGGTNRYLFYQAQNGIRSYAVQPGSRYSFAFGAEHIPNVEVIGVRFTGSTYQDAQFGVSARFDQSLRELTIDVKPDRARYRPGERASLAVRVTDRAGRPVRAEVLLSAVDEALYRLEGESYFYDLGILDSLYQSAPSGVLRVYSSHQVPRASPGAEQGGEGGGRDNFADVGLFQRVTTGDDGRATVPFALPDNLTSWRITALAVTEDLYAGRSVALLPVGLPLFVGVAANDTYLASDKAVVKLRAFGDALSPGERVSFTVSSPTLLPKPLTASGAAFEGVDVSLPALKQGRHQLTYKVEAKGSSDSLVRAITVVPSRLLQAQSRFAEVKAGQSFTPQGSGDRPTRVLLSDHNRGRYYPALESLSYTYGDRLDQMLARDLAQELLLRYFEEGAAFPAVFVPTRYQTPEGGIAIFPFADNDLVLSARVAALAPDRFGRQSLTSYLRAQASDPKQTRERAIIAVYGLAALGEPVLRDVRLLSERKDLTVRERLYAGLAAAEAGDQDLARTFYRDLLAASGEARGSAVRLRVGADADDTAEATVLAAILGAQLADELAPRLFEYTTTNSTKDILVALEQISYLVEAVPRTPASPVTVAYTFGGKRERATIERGDAIALSLLPKDLAALKLEVLEGTLGVAASFLAPVDPATIRTERGLTVTRSYQAGTTIGERDIVRVVLTFDLGSHAVDGCYQLSDLLPSGLRAVARPYSRGIEDQSLAYPYAVEGQRVSFCVSKGQSPRQVVYYARVIAKGTYLAEPAVLQSQRAPEAVGLTKAFSVVIR